MKNITTKLILGLAIFTQSCSTKDCVELEDTTTIQSICDTGLLIMTSDAAPGAPPIFTLDSIAKPVNIPLVFNNIQTELQANFFTMITRPSNYDAYNELNETYFIEFPEQQRLFKYDINSQTRQEFITAGFYVAPVFNNGVLYAISIDTDPSNFGIEIIDQNNGSLTNLTNGSFPLLSSFTFDSMSSATDNNDMIYFVSGTNLISFNVMTSVTNHTELVPTFDIGNDFQRFYGLEMRSNGNLLAIRDKDNLTGEGTELIEIDVNNPTAVPTIVFDFTANGIELNPEFYSSTYDACDDTFYVTSINDDFITTDFYEINLALAAVKTENLPHYLMGIESKYQN